MLKFLIFILLYCLVVLSVLFHLIWFMSDNITHCFSKTAFQKPREHIDVSWQPALLNLERRFHNCFIFLYKNIPVQGALEIIS
jgi:hypothetical protein